MKIEQKGLGKLLCDPRKRQEKCGNLTKRVGDAIQLIERADDINDLKKQGGKSYRVHEIKQESKILGIPVYSMSLSGNDRLIFALTSPATVRIRNVGDPHAKKRYK